MFLKTVPCSTYLKHRNNFHYVGVNYRFYQLSKLQPFLKNWEMKVFFFFWKVYFLTAQNESLVFLYVKSVRVFMWL